MLVELLANGGFALTVEPGVAFLTGEGESRVTVFDIS